LGIGRNVALVVLPLIFVIGFTASQDGLAVGTLGDEHVHANLEVRIFGDKFHFSSPAFQIKSSWIHFENSDGNTIHRHASGVPLGDLFDSLNIGLTDSCYIFPDGRQFCTNNDYFLKFFVNNAQVFDLRNYVVQEGDHILIIFDSDYSTPNPTITVNVSNNSFEEGDTIVISGKVTNHQPGKFVTIQIFNLGNLVEISQLALALDGSFTHTLLASGQQWSDDGTYQVRASYENIIDETNFKFFKQIATADTSDFFEVDAGSSGTFDVEYIIRGGTVKDMIVDSEIFALIVIIESTGDGSLTLDLPRESIDAKKSDGSDDLFIILIDRIQVIYDEAITNQNTRTVTIIFEQGDNEIEILGTFVVGSGGGIPTSPNTVFIPLGSSVPGCEQTNECFIPAEITVNVGNTVKWENKDSAAHTVTSGYAADGPDGTFDSNMLMLGQTFSHTFRTSGEYPYFDMLHPWQAGVVIVKGAPSSGIVDTTPPLLLTPSDMTIDANDSSGARVNYSVKAIDDIDGVLHPRCSPSSGSLFKIGMTTVTCSATDSSGNSDRKSFLITVNSPDVLIPSWVRDVAGFWCEDEIDDASFIEAIQYLINNDVIIVPTTVSIGSDPQEIPNWIKSNACWWSQGLITNSDFASGLQYLIGQGIIRV